ncbi:amidoligase family protein [Maridesulfovibrio sp.]|uniref:amidoligase family protein n=1 Tax=Maridesulfovibrio sp. TaxID=2795000 RepID=UPI0039F0CC74
MNWNIPPRTKTESGEWRRVGFELEFSGVDLESLGKLVEESYGGELRKESPFSYKVLDTKFGDFGLEVDSIQLKDRKYKEFVEAMGFELAKDEIEKVDNTLYDLAKIAVPFELVTPPVPMDKIDELDKIEDALRANHAKGTRASFLYAFGMQFNPECPDLNVSTILNYLRSFLVLLDWLKEEIDVDLTRRILPFINSFPDAYILKILDNDYSPSLEEFMADYLEHNPTRNRPLDLTCLLAHIDKDFTLSKVKEAELIKPRPTFHYRLPDCRIDEDGWSMAKEWNRWVKVEELAGNPEELAKKCSEYLAEASRKIIPGNLL